MLTSIRRKDMRNVDRAKRRLTNDLRHLLEDVQELIEITADQTSERLTALRQRLQNKLAEVKRNLAWEERALMDRTRQTAEKAVHYVEENPWSTLSVALGIGLIAAGLMCRNRS
jgi:ElaB/YqjD/DUF883 family membrane-anchored ribosome-binding protein